MLLTQRLDHNAYREHLVSCTAHSISPTEGHPYDCRFCAAARGYQLERKSSPFTSVILAYSVLYVVVRIRTNSFGRRKIPEK